MSRSGSNDVDLAAVDGIDCVLVDVHADDLDLARCQHRGGWQADVAEADQGYRWKASVHRWASKY